MEELQMSKRSRISNGGNYVVAKGRAHRKDEDEEEGELKRGVSLLPWQNPAARICRVSRASGGKDRHSKVLTAKGLRDRRVRLSVSTALQFYDLQDRLGYDQPSKAVEWLIKAASAAIAELPSLDGAFAELSNHLIGSKQRSEMPPGDEDENAEGEDGQQEEQRPQYLSLTKSTCSSTSETSKGSVLSLSRSESRSKARKRAKERIVREKGEMDDGNVDGSSRHQSASRDAASQCSFTDLLTGSGCQGNNLVTVAQANSSSAVPASFMHKHMRHLVPTVTTDYFSQGDLACQVQKSPHLSGLPAQAHFLNSTPVGVMPFNFASTTATSEGDHAEIQQHLPFLQDHLIPVATVASGGDYNLNFSTSSGLAAFNRGTLQSNSSSIMTHIHHLQRLSSQSDGSNLPFFFGTAPPAASAMGENPFPAGIASRLHMCYGDGYRHSDLKGKGKN